VQAAYLTLTGPGQCRLGHEELDLWRLGPHEVVVRAEASIVSVANEVGFSTQAAAEAGPPWHRFPYRPGAGVVGSVLAAGAEVRQPRVGERVLCFGTHASAQFYDVSGRRPYQCAVAIDRGLDLREALVARMARVADLAAQACPGPPGQTVAVFGLGLVGMLVATTLRRRGDRVIALGRPGARASLAARLGLDPVLEVPATEQVEALAALTDGRGADVVVEATGAWATLLAATRGCRQGGRVVMVGTPRGQPTAAGCEAVLVAQRKSLTLRGVHEWGRPLSTATVRGELAAALAVTRGAAQLITHVVAPPETPALYALLSERRQETLGVMIDWRSG
jgi:NADPH:quinone reductase-like Zn-dependent oxidoreductase